MLQEVTSTKMVDFRKIGTHNWAYLTPPPPPTVFWIPAQGCHPLWLPLNPSFSLNILHMLYLWKDIMSNLYKKYLKFNKISKKSWDLFVELYAKCVYWIDLTSCVYYYFIGPSFIWSKKCQCKLLELSHKKNNFFFNLLIEKPPKKVLFKWTVHCMRPVAA